MDRLIIDVPLVRRLVDHQFPQWKGLSIFPVAVSGWDNRTFHLGENMIVRMPSAAEYALQVEKEQKWLPKLAPSLPVSIPTPLAIGEPGESYPWKWSIYRWLEGEVAASSPIAIYLNLRLALPISLMLCKVSMQAVGPLLVYIVSIAEDR